MKQLSQEPQYKISWGNLKQVSVRALVWEEKNKWRTQGESTRTGGHLGGNMES